MVCVSRRFHPPVSFEALTTGVPMGPTASKSVPEKKLESMGCQMLKTTLFYGRQLVLSQYQRATDGHTDGRSLV